MIATIPARVAARAERMAKRIGDFAWVFRDDDEPEGYRVTDENGACWYAGQQPVAAVDPDGEWSFDVSL